MPTICLVYGFVVALGGFARPLGFAVASGVRGCPKVQSSRIHRHWPVRVKAAQKYGFEYSFECSKDNCASRQAFARGSPERQRRMNSVINWLVALSLTFQWLASTVCTPSRRKAHPSVARTNALAVTKRSNPLRAQQLCLREDRLHGFLLQVRRVAVFVQDALHHDFRSE